jgi:hypothetical protein
MNALQKIENINNSHELAVIEQVVLQGDLSKLDPQQRVTYYHNVCKSVGLNPLTRPFEYILLQGKLTLYVKKDGTEQLRKINGISISKIESKLVDDLYIVTATATTKDGRMDSSTGAVTIGHLKGDAKANALMKAETKAKRRVTLSIAGMGWLDEAEVDSIPSARHVHVDMETGEMKNENVKPLYTASIELDHAKELQQLLNECSEESQKGFGEYIKKSYQTEGVEGLPEKDFEKIKKILVKKAAENQKMLAEKEMTIVVKDEE